MADKITRVLIQGKETVSKASKKAGVSLKNLAQKAIKSKFSIAALGAAAVLAVQDFAEFEKSMVNVGNLTNASREEVKRMSKEVIALSKTTPIAANDLAVALFDVQSAGVDAADSIKFLGVASKLAVGGVTDVKTAVDGLTSIMNAYSMTAADAEKISDKLFMAQVQGKTTVEELSTAIGRVAPVANAAGISLDELLSSIASLTAQGINTNEAVTGLKAAISAITAPSEQAQKAAEDYGIELSQTALEAKGLEGVLRSVTEATKGDVGALKELLGSQEAVNAVIALAKDDFNKLNDSINKVANSTNAAAKANEEQLNTLSGQWGIFKNNIMGASKAFFGALSEIIKPLLKLSNAFSEIISKTNQWRKSFNDLESKTVEELNIQLEKELELTKSLIFTHAEAAQKRVEQIQAELDARKAAAEEEAALLQEQAAKEAEARAAKAEAAAEEIERKKEQALELKEFMDELKMEDDEQEAERLLILAENESISLEERLKAIENFYKNKAKSRNKDLTLEQIATKEIIKSSSEMTDILSGNQGNIAKATLDFAKATANKTIDIKVAEEVAKATAAGGMSFGATLALIAPIIAAGAAGKAANAIFHQGGVVGQDNGTATGSSASMSGVKADEVVAKLQTGEEVLSRAERSELIELMRDIKEGGIGGGNLPMINVMIELDGDVLGEKIIDIQDQVKKGIV
jgi:TP901 family phage tail tape measure protein